MLEQSAVFSYPKQEELIKIERRKVRELKAADYNPKINLRPSGVLKHPGMLKKSKKFDSLGIRCTKTPETVIR